MMFSTEHWIWIAICTLLIMGLTWASLHWRFSFRTSAWIMAGVALVSEIFKIMTNMQAVSKTDPLRGMVLKAGALPLHLCSLLIFALFFLPLSRPGKLRSFLTGLIVPVGLVGSLLAILMATEGSDFQDPHAYQCFLYHACLTWFALYLVLTRQAELGVKAWRSNVLFLFCMAFGMLWVNSALQTYKTNFWYVVRPPVEGLPLLNLDHGWYVYFLTVLALGFVSVSAVHLPFLIAELRKKGSATAVHKEK